MTSQTKPLTPPSEFKPGEITIVVTSNLQGEADSVHFLKTGKKITQSYSFLVDAIRGAEEGDVIGLRGRVDKGINIGAPKDPNNLGSTTGGAVHYAFWHDNGQVKPIRNVSIVPYNTEDPPTLSAVTILGNLEKPTGGGVEGFNIVGPMTIEAKNGNSAAISSPHGSQYGLVRFYDIKITHENPGGFYGGYDLKWGSRMNGTGSYDWRRLDFPPTQEHAVYNDNVGWDHSASNPRFNYFNNIFSPRSGRTGIQLVNRKIDDPNLGPNNPAGSPHSAKGELLIHNCSFNLDNKDNAYGITVVGHLGPVNIRRNSIRTMAGGVVMYSDSFKGLHVDENGFTTSSVRFEKNNITSFSPAQGGKSPMALSGIGVIEFHQSFLMVNANSNRPTIDIDNSWGGPINSGPCTFHNLRLEDTPLSEYYGWANTDFCKVRRSMNCLSDQELNALYSTS